jgi:bacteriocin-like protein
MNDLNFSNLSSNGTQEFKELSERELQEIQGGASNEKTISLPVKPFTPKGGGGCPACLSGYDPRYDRATS